MPRTFAKLFEGTVLISGRLEKRTIVDRLYRAIGGPSAPAAFLGILERGNLILRHRDRRQHLGPQNPLRTPRQRGSVARRGNRADKPQVVPLARNQFDQVEVYRLMIGLASPFQDAPDVLARGFLGAPPS